MTVSREPFGKLPNGSIVEQITLQHPGGIRVSVLTFGGVVRSLVLPDGTDVVLGFDSLAEYVANPMYIGPIIGRYANRIAGARFTLDGVTYDLPKNDGDNCLHGGPEGLHHRLWDARVVDDADGPALELSYRSAAGDEGFPGTLDVRTTFRLIDRDELSISYRAESDAATHATFTWHGYLNLGGHGSGDVLSHELTLASSRYTPVDERMIPTGELRDVAKSPFDFRIARPLGAAPLDDDRQLVLGGGYDHNFVIDAGAGEPAARLVDRATGRWMAVRTSEPGVQLYTGQGLNTRGKDGARYGPHAGVALETQHFPNSPNEPAFPSTLLRPGETFNSWTTYRFGNREDVLRR